jgi:hypothetical protein
MPTALVTGGAALLPLWFIVSGALQHPNYLAYFNELVGDKPEKIIVDSNLDWGQDTLRLARRLKQRGTQVNYFTLNLCPERLVGSLLLYYVAPGSLPQQQKR